MRGCVWLAAIAAGLSYAQEPPTFDRYGGYMPIKRRATGFFRIEQIGTRWMFVTPEGHPYVALGANHTGKFFSEPAQSAQLLARFDGDRTEAEAAIASQMRALSLNAGEAYKPLLPSLKAHYPYIEDVGFPDGEKFRFDVFDPAVRERIRAHVSQQCKLFANNPMVLGVGFADLPVWKAPRMVYYRSLPASAPGKRRYVEWLRAKYPEVQRLNEAYATQFESLDAALPPFNADPDRPSVRADDEEFLGIVAGSLYGLLRSTVREAAPNHLFFGEKFVVRMYPEAVLKAVGRHVDVLLTQALILSPQRPPEWQVFQADGYRREFALVGKPMIVVDWALPFSLGETYQTERGAVKDESHASKDAAAWLEHAFQEQYVIGVFMCQLIGAHGNDRWFPAGRMKRTYLRDDGTPFPARASIMSAAHQRVLGQIYQSLR
ncbi:MAG: hypothetical protein JNL98_05835 [Bryobacterales bacterium]|nr:hypothetical protein [Bryobacterales bacterium]